MSYKTHSKPWHPPLGPLMVQRVPMRKPCTCNHATDAHDPQVGCLVGWEVESTGGCPCEGGAPIDSAGADRKSRWTCTAT